MQVPEFRLKFKYEGGTADEGLLDLYDGAVSLEGIARAVTIATHALVNREIRTRADSAHGAKFFLRSPQRGSFIYDATVFVTGACSSGLFYDFIKYAFQEAVGKLDEIADPPSQSLQKRIEPTIGELPAVLESALIDVHRPIRQAKEITLAVTKPRGEVLVDFDEETGIYLQPRTVVMPDPIVGNVTRYNNISKWGKLYDRSEARIISFFLSPDLTERERSLITWSLHEGNLNREGTLYYRAEAVVSPHDRIKRYNITRVNNQPIS
jgi:hypothetical protein